MKNKFALALLLALFFDAVDYTVGWIPIAGDILDLFAISILFWLIGPIALVGAAELIPGLDFLPLYTGSVIYWYMKGKKKIG